ncbi:MAG: hypothetical protein DMG07_01510 [Acidobacteria bacterium]|nr:MAG: hypothetical protein DMG07_01510 [Acidobacteriota bacterium]
MWKAAALVNGVWDELEVVELPPEPFSSDAVRRAVRERFTNSPLVHYFDREAETSGGTRDAIEIWSQSAQAHAREFNWVGPARIDAVEEALALYPEGEPAAAQTQATRSTLAWHDRTGVIIPLRGDEERIVLDYAPGPRDENRVERLRYRYATPDHRLETILDWRGYFGRQSLIVDGWTTMRRRGHGFVASLRGTVGFVAASVLRRLTREPPTFDQDPTAKSRLVEMSERYPHIASSCPDLSTIRPVQHDSAIVFVHGTVSSGIQGLKDLYPALVAPPPIYRYEHDTFRPLEENASELAKLIGDRVHARRLLIAAHSRGGLVARIALAELERGGYPADVAVYAFGTPHEGTPLVAAGGKALNLLFKLGEDIVGAIPLMTPVTKAFSYLYDAPTLPRGIEVMRERSDAVAMLRLLGDPAQVRSWGSEFDVEKAPSGFAVEVEGALLGSFKDRFHDLVVPRESALAFGTKEPVLTCSHVHYFLQPEVRAAIQSFRPAPAPQPVPPQPPVHQDLEVTTEYIEIGGIRLPRQPKPNPVATGQDITALKPLVINKAGGEKAE